MARVASIFSIVLILAALSACGGAQSNSATARPKVVIDGTSILIIDSDEMVPIEIHFKVDSDVLDGESFGALEVLADFMRGHPELTVVEVHGHTDPRGTAQHNLDLSRRRAVVVVGYLVNKGVDGERLRSKGFGAKRPAAKGSDESAYSQNRRVEFLIAEQRMGDAQ